MAYAKKEDILAIMKFFRPQFDVTNISDDIQTLATADVNANLLWKHIPVPAADISDMLKVAEICYYMEHSAMAREVENAFGVISQETVGRYTKKYENGMPMFFFAKGSSIPFLELLPHETWRMRGYKYLTAYSNAYIVLHGLSPYSAVRQDNTSRGSGWSDDVEDWDDTERRLV